MPSTVQQSHNTSSIQITIKGGPILVSVLEPILKVSASIGIEIIKSLILIKFYVEHTNLGTNLLCRAWGRKRSEIWNYFTIAVSDEKVVCHEDVVRGGDKTNSFNTSNLQKHLKCRHPDKLRKLEESEKEASKKKEAAKEQTSFSQAMLEECLEWTCPYPIDHPVAQGSLVSSLR